jgi:hypothetical protein
MTNHNNNRERKNMDSINQQDAECSKDVIIGCEKTKKSLKK